MSIMTSRRTLAKGALWAAPTVVASAAIPAYAASPSLCNKVVAQISTGTGYTRSSDGTTATINGLMTKPDGSQEIITIRMSTVKSPRTLTKSPNPNNSDYNLTWADSSTKTNKLSYGNSRSKDTCGNDDRATPLTFISQPGAIVFNQIGADAQGQNVCSPTEAAQPSQTVTITATDSQGKPLVLQDVMMNIADISSATKGQWRAKYWDAVYFDKTPTIIPDIKHVGDAGTGTGVAGDPFKRSTNSNPTPPPTTSSSGWNDQFTFPGVVGTSLSMTYVSGSPNNVGWQFIALTDLEFMVCPTN